MQRQSRKARLHPHLASVWVAFERVLIKKIVKSWHLEENSDGRLLHHCTAATCGRGRGRRGAELR